MTAREALLESLEARFAQMPARLGVAVSGGSDSLALLHLLQECGRSDLRVVTVDHRLRPTSASEALHVARMAAGLGLPHDILTWEGWDGKGNVQAEARRTRYALLADWAKTHALDAVALGHTQDDQAETFLMRLGREAGVDGLSCMAPMVERHGMRFVRPLLTTSRAVLRDDLERRDVTWIDDPSNEDLAYERVRARQTLLTLSELGITAEVLSATAGNMAQARRALAEQAAAFAQDHAKAINGDLMFDRARLNRLPNEIRRRLLSGALRWVSSADYPPRREPLADAEAALREVRNVSLHGCRVLVSNMTVRVVREHAAVNEARTPPPGPWDQRWRLDGPDVPGLEIRALGDGVNACPAWRNTGMPRASLLASPAVWQGDELIAAPVAGLENGWTATTQDLAHFAATLIAH